MGASYSKLTPGHQEAIYRLRKERNEKGAPRSGEEIRRALAEGVDGEPPVSISADRALKVARKLMDERDELYASAVRDLPANEALRNLTDRLMIVAEKETIKLERAQNQGRLDTSRVAKLATALTRLHALQERLAEPDRPQPPGKSKDGEAVPSTFADRLAEGEVEVAPADEVLAPVVA